MIILTSCGSSTIFDFYELKENVIKVEFVEINDLDEYETIYVLYSERLDEFLEELSELRFRQLFGMSLATRVGVGIKLVYYNDEYEIIYNGLIIRYGSNHISIGRMRHKQTTQSQFDALIRKYKIEE